MNRIIDLNNISQNAAFLMSISSMMFYWVNLAFPRLKLLLSLAQQTSLLTIFSVTYILGSRWVIYQYFPLSNLYESLLFLSWGLLMVHKVIEYNFKNSIIGSVILPLVMFIIAFTSFSLPTDMQQASPLVPALKSNWLMMHVSVMILSYATLMIGSVLSILFLVISKGKEVAIKGSSTGYTPRTPNLSYNLSISSEKANKASDITSGMKLDQLTLLESIDNLSYRIISLGFPLLTLGIISGAVWANEAWGSYWSWDPKETWALITWLIFATYLHTRITKSWQGKKPATLASIGFLIIWVCYLGVNFIGKGLHNYGWVL